MEILTIVLLAIGLAMDAFAVSVCKGLAMGKATVRSMVIIGAWFGFFQFLMPIIGFYVGRSFKDAVEDYDHWIAFALLLVIGLNMVREGISGEEENVDASLGFRIMLILAIATSIDALAVGISLAMDEGTILVPSVIIGVITMGISMTGVKIGSLLGDRLGNRAEILGGIILVTIGFKVLFEHLGYF
ncbi:putative membrane protein [Thermoplasmatales archaeon BRNA1]|nr:putative membrane protein [Thermoplasmatales archaeon BRNA1]